MKTIHLKNKRWFHKRHGFFIAFVSDEDYDRVLKHNWYASIRPSVSNTRAYACTLIDGKMVYLHRFLTGETGIHDHIDGNGLNNSRENIRITTSSGNQLNTYKHRNGTLFDRRKRWKANVFGRTP